MFRKVVFSISTLCLLTTFFIFQSSDKVFTYNGRFLSDFSNKSKIFDFTTKQYNNQNKYWVTREHVKVDYITDGEPMNWYGDGSSNSGSWLYELPFQFQIGDKYYNRVYVSEKGFLNFTNSDSMPISLDDPGVRLMVYGDDLSILPPNHPMNITTHNSFPDLTIINHDIEGIYISRSSDSVTFRWRAQTRYPMINESTNPYTNNNGAYIADNGYSYYLVDAQITLFSDGNFILNFLKDTPSPQSGFWENYWNKFYNRVNHVHTESYMPNRNTPIIGMSLGKLGHSSAFSDLPNLAYVDGFPGFGVVNFRSNTWPYPPRIDCYCAEKWKFEGYEPQNDPNYPILLVHGWQMVLYNPLEIWQTYIHKVTGRELKFDQQDAISKAERISAITPMLVQDDTFNQNHYVYKISPMNGNYRAVFVSDYNSILLNPTDPIHSKRFVTIDDLKFYADCLKKEIDVIKSSTGYNKVQIIAHSMGGLVSRTYIESEDFDCDYAKHVYPLGTHRMTLPTYSNDVYRLIMIGTPNHGTQMAKILTNSSKCITITLQSIPANTIIALANQISEQIIRDKLYDGINKHLPFDMLGFSFLEYAVKNLCCIGQMDTSSDFLKILNYNMDTSWNLSNTDLLQNGVYYHLIGGIIPRYECNLLLLPKYIANCYTSTQDQIEEKLKKDENLENLVFYDDGLVPGNSVRIYNTTKQRQQYDNLNHLYVHADHSQLIRNDKIWTVVKQIMGGVHEKINISDHWKLYNEDFEAKKLYKVQSAVVFSPVLLTMNSGNESITFDLQNSTEDAFVDYLNGTIQWLNPPSSDITYKLEGYEEGTYGVRFTSTKLTDNDVEAVVFETHGLPTTVGQIDRVQIDWNSKEYTFTSDINGDGTVDKTIHPPTSPYNLQSKLQENDSVQLSWQPSKQGTNSIKGYQIYRMGSKEESFSAISLVTAYESLTYTDLYLDSSQSYIYYVQAVDTHNLASISSNMSHVSFQKETSQILIKLSIGSKYAMVSKEGNDSYVQLDLAPLVKDARTFVPLRFIAEAFGAKVDWYYDPIGESKGRIEIALSRNDGSLLMLKMRDLDPVVQVADYPPGTLTPKRSQYTMDTAPFIVRPQGRTVVPIRFVAECFGAEVEWEANTKTITIRYEQ
jgi:triacylglycerol esterase/lipase EstA (alpha/beta hydrolase family)